MGDSAEVLKYRSELAWSVASAFHLFIARTEPNTREIIHPGDGTLSEVTDEMKILAVALSLFSGFVSVAWHGGILGAID